MYNNFNIETCQGSIQGRTHVATCTDENGAIMFAFGASHADAIRALLVKINLFNTRQELLEGAKRYHQTINA